MDYNEIARKLIKNLGGIENINGYAVCVTRIRINLKDISKVNHEEITKTEKIIGIVNNEEQYQIIAEIDAIPKISKEMQHISKINEKSMRELFDEENSSKKST